MSGLRCRPGELAVHVNSFHEENIGCIVEVVKYAGLVFGRHAWVTEGGKTGIYSLDEHLRPLRGGEGQDETMQWAGLPAPIKQPVSE